VNDHGGRARGADLVAWRVCRVHGPALASGDAGRGGAPAQETEMLESATPRRLVRRECSKPSTYRPVQISCALEPSHVGAKAARKSRGPARLAGKPSTHDGRVAKPPQPVGSRFAAWPSLRSWHWRYCCKLRVTRGARSNRAPSIDGSRARPRRCNGLDGRSPPQNGHTRSSRQPFTPHLGLPQPAQCGRASMSPDVLVSR
jgi:hypothetical protein